jgi:hypothetical protein
MELSIAQGAGGSQAEVLASQKNYSYSDSTPKPDNISSLV